jgi:hypothetical protein
MSILPEIIVLWILFSLIIGFFVGYKEIIYINICFMIFIIICIISGFFIGIGIKLFNLFIA